MPSNLPAKDQSCALWEWIDGRTPDCRQSSPAIALSQPSPGLCRDGMALIPKRTRTAYRTTQNDNEGNGRVAASNTRHATKSIRACSELSEYESCQSDMITKRVDKGHDVAAQFLKACGDASKLPETGKNVLDAVARFHITHQRRGGGYARRWERGGMTECAGNPSISTPTSLMSITCPQREYTRNR